MKVVVVGAPTYFARRRPPRTPDARPPQLHSISPSGGLRIRVATRAGRQIATDFARWPGHCERYGFGGSRSRRRVGNCVHDRSSRRPFPALGAAGACAGRLVALLCRPISLLSRPPASAGGAARPYRHAPQRPRGGAGRRLARDPLSGRVNAIGAAAGAGPRGADAPGAWATHECLSVPNQIRSDC